jgi:trehalose 6-phosphate synthase/phosphatase
VDGIFVSLFASFILQDVIDLYTDMSNVVIVSNRLPMSVQKVGGKLVFGQSMGGLATGLSTYTKRRGTKWIGWPGIPSDDLTEAEQSRITRELRKHRCYPVFLTKKQIDDYYNGYSNTVIWPLFHNLSYKPGPAKFWRGYREVNKLFADAVLSLTKPDSVIWVHDYQLMLVPQLLRRAGPGSRIGFFLHIPFPEPKTLDKLPEAKSLLRGILGADLAGFHTRSYTRHFFASCEQFLHLTNQQGQLLLGERPVHATEFPMGIDYARFAEATKPRHKRKELREIRRKYRKQRVIVSVDRLDPSKGLVERLRAYQQLLRQHPKWQGKVTLAMIVAPSRTEVEAYKKLKSQIDKTLAEIEAEFTTKLWKPIDFIYETVPLDTVMLYYQVADVAFIAPLRDGMNLVAKEYIASKRRNNGVLVLSETAGAAEELHGAIQVNPRQAQTMVDGLVQALNMPKRELRERARSMQQHIQQFTVQKWAESFMGTLQRPRALGPERTRSLTDTLQTEMVFAYRRAKKRLLLLDYDGVLRRFVRNPADAEPSQQLIALLRQLSADPANEIIIISGRQKDELLEWFGDLPIALAAEHGLLFRRRGGKNWHKTVVDDRKWKAEIQQIFDYYTDITAGAHTETKEWSVAWHYRAASPYYAQKHLVALRRLLKPYCKQYGLRLEEGHKVLEVRPSSASKGRVAHEWLIHDHDFALMAGDDATDEDMFAMMPPNGYSIKVGHGRTLAHYRLKGVSEMLALLDKLK